MLGSRNRLGFWAPDAQGGRGRPRPARLAGVLAMVLALAAPAAIGAAQEPAKRDDRPERGIAMYTEFSGVVVPLGETVRMDLTVENMARWHKRLEGITSMVKEESSGETSSRFDRAYPSLRKWVDDDRFEIGEMVAWVSINEDEGRRGKD